MRTFPAVRIEGGLLGPDTLDALLTDGLPGQKPKDFGLDGHRGLTEEIAATFAEARALWGVFQSRLARLDEQDPATTLTRNAWLIPFLTLLGYELRANPRAYEVDGLTFAISHRAGEAEDAPPVHLVGARQRLGSPSPTGRPRLSPHALVQEYLNRSEALWGLTSNGLTLRLLRDSSFVRRQAYVEFDLAAIFDQQLFLDFAALYRLLHRTRLPTGAPDASRCLLEQYHAEAVQQGGRVRKGLRMAVKACLTALGSGFLAHPANDDLRRRVSSAGAPAQAAELYHQLLRLVYRFLFLLVSEERGLISDDPLYQEHYGVSRLRRLVDQRAAYTEHDDLWQSLRVLWRVLADERFAAMLHVAPLNGELFAPLELDAWSITNRDLLTAFRHLAYYRDDTGAERRVNYAALDTEELGSVYESLLELHPVVVGHSFQLDEDEQGAERRVTGSHYTPTELVAPLIQHALEPVLTERLARATTTEQKVAAILSLKVCDPACGSGHFLLAAARRLGKELARVQSGEEEPAPEAVREATRAVIAHCLYGVDKNPLAVELCKVALWLEGHAAGKPLTFLDHRIRCGDSLVGVADLQVLRDGIPDGAYDTGDALERAAARAARERNRAERARSPLFQVPLREDLDRLAVRWQEIEAQPQDTPEQVRRKAEAHGALERSAEHRRLWLACDVWTAAFFQPYDDARAPVTTQALHDALSRGHIADARLAGLVQSLSAERRFFHWPLAFPDVLAAGGFDVVLGNPPFMGGLKISGAFGPAYRRWLENAYPSLRGTADLCAAFFRRAYRLLRPGGRTGMIATNTLGQGDTREGGLAVIIRDGGTITFAQRFVKWPGEASVEVNLVVVGRPGATSPAGRKPPLLDGRPVAAVSSRLDAEPDAEPTRLQRNLDKAFQGDIVRGIGFVVEPGEAEALLAKDPRNADCLFPYLNGDDLNSDPKQRPSRWVICFHDWSLERACQYPDLLRIVEERVRPERERLRGPGDRANREHWWQFGAYRAGLRRAIAPLQRVLVRSRISELHMLVFVPKGWIYGDATIVFAFDDDYHFALLQSHVHEVWVWRQASTMRTDIRYTPTDCFATFPFPPVEYAESDWRALLAKPPFAEAARLGGEYHEHRRQVMLARNQGLTATYNLFHNPACADPDIARLRELHEAIDRAVLACYGWQDLDLGHDFHQNERGQTRFTISPAARRALLQRLLELNLRLAAEEAGTGR